MEYDGKEAEAEVTFFKEAVTKSRMIFSFGCVDKAWIKLSDCFLLSHPTVVHINRKKIFKFPLSDLQSGVKNFHI